MTRSDTLISIKIVNSSFSIKNSSSDQWNKSCKVTKTTKAWSMWTQRHLLQSTSLRGKSGVSYHQRWMPICHRMKQSLFSTWETLQQTREKWSFERMWRSSIYLTSKDSLLRPSLSIYRRNRMWSKRSLKCAESGTSYPVRTYLILHIRLSEALFNSGSIREWMSAMQKCKRKGIWLNWILE